MFQGSVFRGHVGFQKVLCFVISDIGGLFARFIEEGRATLDDRGLVAMILSWPPLHFFAHHI